MKPSIAKHFGINNSPAIYRGGPYGMFVEDLQELIMQKEMICLTGEIGAGKTTLFQDVQRKTPGVKFVYVRSLDKERLRVGSIVDALVYDLSSETPRQKYEARSRQLNRILGEVAVDDRQTVVLVIENAHRLHGNTILALKELREMSFAGVCPLFGIVLVGWSLLKAKIERLKEIYLRMNFVGMTESEGWMTFTERKNYLETVYGTALAPEVRAQVAMSARLPLEMKALIEQRMIQAYYQGKAQLEVNDFEVPLKEMKEVVGLSLEDLAEETGKHRSTISRVLNDKPGYENPTLKAKIREAIERHASKKPISEAI